MSAYALLGATGNVGGEILRVLLESTSSSPSKPQIKALVRSKAKLEKQLQTDRFRNFDHSNVEISEAADIFETEVLANCLRRTKAVFMCAAAQRNEPSCSIAQRQAKAVLSALEALRKEDSHAKLPRLVMLSSAEAEEIPHFSAEIPWPFRSILFNSNYFIYKDLIAAEKYIRNQGDWFDYCIVKPGGISWDISRGHELRFDIQQTFISYVDVVSGMIELADDETGRYNERNVSIISPGGKAKTAIENVPMLFKGLLITYFPFLHEWI